MLKIKKDFVIRSVAGSIIVVPVGKETLDFNGMITLNESGELLWRILENGAEVSDLKKALCEKYGIDDNTAQNDATDFVNMVKEAGLLE